MLRTFEWDRFIERQVERYRTSNPGVDFFVSADSTRGPIGAPDDPAIVEAGTAELLALGLPSRFGKGSLVWWNNDYWYYAFRAGHPGYAFYVFVEYDSVVLGSLAAVIEQVRSRGLDFVAAPVPGRIVDWSWWPYTKLVYPETEIRASINCVAVLSGRALDVLYGRRLAMAADVSVTHWPISEAFVATEVGRAGLCHASLEEFGETRHYDWFSPMLEDDLPRTGATAFFHPVLDPPRYLASVARFGRDVRPYLDPASGVRRSLARMTRREAARLLCASLKRRLKVNRADRRNDVLLRTGRLPGW